MICSDFVLKLALESALKIMTKPLIRGISKDKRFISCLDVDGDDDVVDWRV